MVRKSMMTQAREQTLLINDDVRVYMEVLERQGVLLDPAQRRYFPQDMATDYIGFRCNVKSGSEI
jgi:hypothetical protein